ncbi:hypothetical protein [Kitasatospora phosalacinea]|uniref:hypothetical protein n=1 Tax=Kitasatospora phosalacinea TaxID=2065 RepID=UPI00068F9CCC|nr:hypothetical protein [Kitasatospora phosalacinea]
MSGPKCTAYECDQALTAAALRAAAEDAALREAVRRREEAALRAAAARDGAVRAVKARNARIAALATAAEEFRQQYGTVVTGRPVEALEPGTRSTSELEEWCAEADRALDATERELREQVAGALAAGLFDGLPGHAAGRGPVGAAELFGAPGGAAEAGEAEAGEAERGDVERALARVLSRLLPDCTADHRADVRLAAARVAGAATLDEAHTWLVETRLRVRRANEAAEAGRRDAAEATGLLHDLEPARSPEADRVRALLAEVVSGHRALDGPLRRRAADCRAEAEAAAERRYVVEAVTDALTELGYQVGQGFETLTVSDGALRLSRDEWSEHAVNLVVDQEGRQLRTALVRTAAGAGDDGAHLDVEREEQWCRDFQALRGRLARAGLSTEVRLATPPGQVPVPLVVPPAAGAPRARTAHRERER